MEQETHASLRPEYTRVVSGEIESRVTFLGEGVLRIRTSFVNDFEEASLALLLTAWPDQYDELLLDERIHVEPLVPTLCEREDSITLCADSLTVTVSRNPFAAVISNGDGEVLFQDIPYRAYEEYAGQIHHSFCLDEALFYGFGEKTGPLEKSGESMRMTNRDACGYDPVKADPLYKHVPFFIKLNKRTGHACGIYYNTACDCGFDIGREYNGYWPGMGRFSAESRNIDLFFLEGPSIQDVVKRFALLVGRPAMLPRNALGYLGSTMYYSEMEGDCAQRILQFVDKTQRESMPCTGYMLSSGYTTDCSNKRHVFSWNLAKFSDPAAFISAMHEKNALVIPNIKPGMLRANPKYNQFEQQDGFITDSEGKAHCTKFWGGTGSFVDFSNPKGRALWKNCLKEQLLDKGVMALWNDNNEFDLRGSDLICHREGVAVPMQQMKAELPTLMCIAGRDALLEAYPQRRPYQVTRSGGTGISRYAQTWTGDNATSWESLRWGIATVLGSSLSGMPQTGCDVGGFAGPLPEAELLLRWIWLGVFLPRFSIHSANNDNTVTEPWMYPEIGDSVRSAFTMRQKLIPYLYSLSYTSSQTGEPIVRPMVYHYPRDPMCQTECVDFMLGDALLVVPVVQKGQKERTVYLPQGETFYDFYTHDRYDGGQHVILDTSPSHQPLLMRKGSIFALDNDDCIALYIVPGKRCTFDLYEDDGYSNAYLNQEYSLLRWTSVYETQTEMLTLCLTREGKLLQALNKPLEFIVICESRAPHRIILNDMRLSQALWREEYASLKQGWYFNAGEKQCHIKCESSDTLKTLKVCFDHFDLIDM